MATVQISRIQNRQGLSENLPQLAGGEFGWSIDTRELFIGNGTLENGAPFIGNTQILTQYSDIINLTDTYTYKGEEAGYVVDTGELTGQPVTRKLQHKLDDFASVRDFGAVGDGTTDDTSAINRALYELFSREENTQVRRSLFFPAGTYLVTDSILIPPFAKLVGEGLNSSTIKLDSTSAPYVARTTDSLQQTGSNIGTESAITPQNIEISSMSFETVENTDIFLVESVEQMFFDSVSFKGPLQTTDLNVASVDVSCIRTNGTAASIPRNVIFDKCSFSHMTYAINLDERCQGWTVSNSKFETLYNGIVLGNAPVDGGPKGFRATHNLFNEIYSSAIVYDQVTTCSTAYNIFLSDCGNQFGSSPQVEVIEFGSDNNISIGDMFERNDTQSLEYARIETGTTTSIAVDNTEQFKLGNYVRKTGVQATLTDNTTTKTTVFELNSDDVNAWSMDYTIRRGTKVRHGKLVATNRAVDATDSGTQVIYSDDYLEDAVTGVVLSVEHIVDDTYALQYTSGSLGTDATLTYSIAQLG